MWSGFTDDMQSYWEKFIFYKINYQKEKDILENKKNKDWDYSIKTNT